MGRARLSNVVMDWVNAFAYDGKLILILSLCCIHSSTACTPTSLTCSVTQYCDCTATSMSDSGVIMDGPLDYENCANCAYRFNSAGIVNVRLTQFRTELTWDFLTILICTTETCTSSLQLLRVSGATTSLTNVYSTTTTHRFMRVTLTSDARTVAAGFTANWWISSIIPCNCLAGSYGMSVACTACPLQSTSPAGSTVITQCICNSGSTGSNGGPCLMCAPGKYKSTPGTLACVDCPLNQISLQGSTAVTACVCNAGWTGANGVCTECEAGKYKSAAGPEECSDCANGIFPEIGKQIGCTICAAGQGSSIALSPGICTEPTYIPAGTTQGWPCANYRTIWSNWCVHNGNCEVCSCSCIHGIGIHKCPVIAIPDVRYVV